MQTRYTLWAMALGTLLLTSPAAGQRGAALSEDPDGVAVPAPWLQQDVGDSLYQVGRTALNRGDYRTAARQFRALRERYPSSGYAGDAYYWEAFARAKLGSKEEMRTAMDLIETQAERHPEARTVRDARELRVRIQGDLAQLGDAASAAAVAEAATSPRVPRAGQGSESCSEDDDERLIALNALLQMRAEQALPILRQVMERRDEGSVCLRRQAMFLVSQLHIVSQQGSPGTAAILLSAARNDPDAEVRENAVFWLSQVDAPEATAALDSILQHGSDAALQEKAVFALSQQGNAAASRALRAHLERPGVSDDVKEDIIFWLGQTRSAETAQYLKDFYAKTTSVSLKEKVMFSLSEMSMEENARWLIGIAQNQSESIELRKNALFWAGQMEQVPIGDLVAMFGQVADREIKEQLIFVYAQRPEAEAVDKLMQIARTETDPDLRKTALFWLSQSQDPRVAEFLLEMINK